MSAFAIDTNTGGWRSIRNESDLVAGEVISDFPLPERPTNAHIFSGTVSKDPSICWRPPTAPELDIYRDTIIAQIIGSSVSFDEVLKAFALVVMEEINILRAQHALPDRTVAQLHNAMKAKLGIPG